MSWNADADADAEGNALAPLILQKRKLMNDRALSSPHPIESPTVRTASNGTIDAVLLAMLTAGYWFAAIRSAATRPLWMDEVLSKWTARLPDISAIWDALNRGSDFSPPPHYLLLHQIIALGGDNVLALRLPSIAAIYIAAFAAFVLMRRYYGVPASLLAMALCLAGGLLPFAVQARPYALVAACFASALVVWDSTKNEQPSWRRTAALFALLVMTVSLHFYAVLLATSVGLMELIWTVKHRRIRWIYMFAIGLACISILLWLPLMQHISALNSGDTDAAGYYARPRAASLPIVYALLMVGYDASIIATPLTVMITAIVGWIGVKIWFNGRSEIPRTNACNLDIIIGVTCAIPLFVFAFSALVTHTFNLRYVVAAAIGLSLLTARLIAVTRNSTAYSYFVIAASIGLFLHASIAELPLTPRERALAMVEQAPRNLPIVTGNALRFIELRESASASVTARLTYLKSPAGTVSPDPTNENQLMRWLAINPDLAIADIAPFANNNPRFVLFYDEGATDLLPAQLQARGDRINILKQDGDAYLAEIDSPSR